jgi:hypothetical protein
MEDAHLQALVGKFLPRFLISCYHCRLLAVHFALTAFFRSGRLSSGVRFEGYDGGWSNLNPPKVCLTKRLFAKVETSYGTELSSM